MCVDKPRRLNKRLKCFGFTIGSQIVRKRATDVSLKKHVGLAHAHSLSFSNVADSQPTWTGIGFILHEKSIQDIQATKCHQERSSRHHRKQKTMGIRAGEDDPPPNWPKRHLTRRETWGILKTTKPASTM